MDFLQKNNVVTQRFEAEEGNFKYTITSTTSDNVVQQVSCDVDEVIEPAAPVDGEPMAEPSVVRLGNISMANGYKNLRFKQDVAAAQHLAAFESFLASISA